MTARWCSRNQGGKDSRGKETKEIRGCERCKGVTIERWRQNKGKDWGEMKNKNERKRGRKQREARKSEMWAIHKQTSPRDLGPAHLLLFTSEEIDTVEERLLAPGQNHCSAKLETGRTVGKAQIKNALPTWTQYTAALILCWKPKTQQHYFMSSSTERLQCAQWLYRDSLQCPSLDDGILWPSKYCPFWWHKMFLSIVLQIMWLQLWTLTASQWHIHENLGGKKTQ